MPTILIIGASRGIGLEAVKASLAAGYTVRALARSADDIALNHRQLNRICGDARDEALIVQALEGATAVIQALGVPITATTVLQRTTLFSEASRVLVGSMRTTGVRRLVAVTGVETGDSRGSAGFLHARVLFPLILQRIYSDKNAQERIIQASGLDWTIARPGVLTNGPATGRYQVLTEANSLRGGFISRCDVADFLVRQLADDTNIGRCPLLIG